MKKDRKNKHSENAISGGSPNLSYLKDEVDFGTFTTEQIKNIWKECEPKLSSSTDISAIYFMGIDPCNDSSKSTAGIFKQNEDGSIEQI